MKGGDIVKKNFRIRLLPNQSQEELMWKHSNCSRFAWNWMMQRQEESYTIDKKYLSKYTMRDEFKVLRTKDEYEWTRECSSHMYGLVAFDLDNSYQRFFKGITKRPKFKSKKKAEIKFPIRCDTLYFKDGLVKCDVIGRIKYQTNFDFPQGGNRVPNIKVYNARIKYISGKWILSFSMEVENQEVQLTDKTMGIDLGIRKLAVVSFGEEVIMYKNINKNSEVVALKKKITHVARRLSKKYHTNNTSNRYENKWHKSNAIIKYEKLYKTIYGRLTNIRRNNTHQVTRELVNKLPKKIIMEDLNISAMLKNKKLSGAIIEQTWFEFFRQIRYKSEALGIELEQADRFFPSSKTCSSCGQKSSKSKREKFICQCCGFEIDRDINASRNLMNYSKV
jgi:putative transposase